MSRLLSGRPGYQGSIFNRVRLTNHLHFITPLWPFDPEGATDLLHVGNYLQIESFILEVLVLNEARGQISLLCL